MTTKLIENVTTFYDMINNKISWVEDVKLLFCGHSILLSPCSKQFSNGP